MGATAEHRGKRSRILVPAAAAVLALCAARCSAPEGGGTAGEGRKAAESATTAGAGRPASPGFIVILADDMSWAGTSVPMLPEVPEGACAYLETPSLERLAAEGMRFGQAYAPAPLCTPTRRSLLCGLNPARQRGTEFESEFDPAAHLTLPRALKAVDPRFRCAHFGKWGELMGADPDACGYDESDGPTVTADGNVAIDSLDTGVRTDPDPKRTFSVTRRALEFLDARAADGAPFYLQVSYYAVHRPLEAREETLLRYEERETPPRTFPRGFAAMTTDLDDAVGQLLDRLEDPALQDRTWVLFTSDNGGTEFDRSNPLYSEHGATAARGTGRGSKVHGGGAAARLPSNYPLRGSKQRLYEGGIRVPFVIAGPGVASGTVCRAPVVLTDLLPTLVDLAGGTLPADVVTDGATFRAPLESAGEGTVARPLGILFHRPDLGFSALREGNRKLIAGWTGGGGPVTLELYDVVEDPGESRDLAAELPEERDAMFARLIGRLEAMDAEIPPHAPPAAAEPR